MLGVMDGVLDAYFCYLCTPRVGLAHKNARCLFLGLDNVRWSWRRACMALICGDLGSQRVIFVRGLLGYRHVGALDDTCGSWDGLVSLLALLHVPRWSDPPGTFTLLCLP